MAISQTFDTSNFGMALLDRSAEATRRAREVGAEMFNLSVRNFECATKAARELASVRDFGEAARIQANWLSEMMTVFADHSGKIVEIVTDAGREATVQAAEMAGTAKDMADKAIEGAGKAVSGALSEADKGFAGVRKF